MLFLFGGQDFFCCWKSWVEDDVDTVGDRVLLLFGGQDVLEILGGKGS